jgi:hypothetical protein
MDLHKRNSWRRKDFTWISSFSGFIICKQPTKALKLYDALLFIISS